MSACFDRILLLSLALLLALPALALTGVNPTGVNVNASGVTTVFLTFQGTNANEQPAGAFWCGEITVPANTVTATNPCVAGTLFGNLLERNDLSRASGTNGQSNFTDIMTIPSSVARRAYQAAQRGSVSSFFYVRRFINTVSGAESFVAVTCRLAGGGARVPLALTDVRIDFVADQGERPVYLIRTDSIAPPVVARIRYNGSGRLTGLWEVVRPGDSPPRTEDLVPAASLPVELRSQQRRYTQLSRVELFLPPTGEVELAGPDPKVIPTDLPGAYWLVLRIEASDDKEGDSNTNAGVANSGGVAGFPLPPLRYYVGDQEVLSKARAGKVVPVLLEPVADSLIASGAVRFTWQEAPGAAAYRLEVRSHETLILTSTVPRGAQQYQAPPWLFEQRSDNLAWRLVALDSDGGTLESSSWVSFALQR